MRLSALDLNGPFSMNTHLHLLEAYTGLLLASDGPRHRDRLRAVLDIMLGRIIDAETGHLILFHDEHWRPMSAVVSYGHEIETSWLLCEAADALADGPLSARADAAALRLADGVMVRGYDAANGGILYEQSGDGHLDTNKEWWGQAEGVVGLLNAFELSGRDEFLQLAVSTPKLVGPLWRPVLFVGRPDSVHSIRNRGGRLSGAATAAASVTPVRGIGHHRSFARTEDQHTADCIGIGRHEGAGLELAV